MKKQSDKISAVLMFLGVIIFVAMGLNVTPLSNNIMIFLGVLCFLLAGLVKRLCRDNKCSNSEGNNKY